MKSRVHPNRPSAGSSARPGRTRLIAPGRMLGDAIEEEIVTRGETIEMPAHILVCLRGTVAERAAESQLRQRFRPAVQGWGVEPVGPGGCIEHDGEFREADVDVTTRRCTVHVKDPSVTPEVEPETEVCLPGR